MVIFRMTRMKGFILVATAITSCVLFLGWLQPTQVRIFLIGDSTMADKPLVDNPEHGWGQMLPIYFEGNVHVFNHAKNGRSTRSFLTEGRWKKVYDQLLPGDYVFIQFGHNDAKKEDTARFAAPRPEYEAHLRQYIREAREKQAIPILLTPITRRDFDSAGIYKGSHGEYPAVMKEVAKQENVPLIDMFEKTKELVSKLGDAGSKELYLAGVNPGDFRAWSGKRDNTHFTRKGAVVMAGLVVDGIKELHLPLEQSLVQNLSTDLVGTKKTVCLDYYFNNEWRIEKDSTFKRWHYTWEDTTNSGFSQLGSVIDRLGADVDTLPVAPQDSTLKRASVYILVDPDTPMETKNPNYISEADIAVIERWVKNGGVLMLMANDSGNCEFAHLNKLAERFGLHFNEDSRHKVIGKAYDTGKNDNLPQHPMFLGVHQIFTKEVSTLRLEKPAEPILTEKDFVLMASAHIGKGLVFAVGDPWLYNEYFDTRKLPAEYENARAGKSLMSWLLSQAQPTKQ